MADRLHLQPKHRQMLESLLCKHLPEVEVWAYGSRVTGRSHDGSDLDLVLRSPGLGKIPVGQLGDFEEAVRESNIPFLVEARDWARLPERFHREIERGHVVLVEGSEDRAGEPTESSIGEFAPLHYGKGLAAGDRNSQGAIPVFGSNGIVGRHDCALTSHPTVIVGRKGTVGAVHWSPVPCWPIDTTYFVTDPDPSILRFKYYALKSFSLADMNSHSAVPGLNREAVHGLRLLVPPPFEQRAIAHILGTLDDRIELNRRMNETLEAMARALFKSWFVDFEPVRDKMKGRYTGLLASIASLFPQELTTIDKRDIPLGWPLKPLGELIKLNYGKALRKDRRIPGNFPVLGSGGSHSSHVEPLVRHPTVVVGRKGTVGSIQWAPRGCWPIDTTYYVVSTVELPMTYVYRQLQHLPLAEMNTDAAVPGLNRSNAYRLDVPFPGVELASKFADIADPLQARIDANENHNSALVALRDALLPKLISGEIRLPEAERVVQETAVDCANA